MHSRSQKLGSTKKFLLEAIFPIIHLHNTCPHVCPQLGCVMIWGQQFLSQKSHYPIEIQFSTCQTVTQKYISSQIISKTGNLLSFRHISVLVMSALSLRLFLVPPLLLLLVYKMLLLNHIQAAPKYLCCLPHLWKLKGQSVTVFQINKPFALHRLCIFVAFSLPH